MSQIIILARRTTILTAKFEL